MGQERIRLKHEKRNLSRAKSEQETPAKKQVASEYQPGECRSRRDRSSRGARADPPSLSFPRRIARNAVDLDVDPEERLLRSFDLNSKFGPCMGLSRMERWERARDLGLDPPEQVRQTLLGGGKEDALWGGRV